MKDPGIAELLGLDRAGEIRWGLGRTRRLLHAVGAPHMAFDSIHVGGTNGKGSVAAIIASIARAAGFRVGLYTSPHLLDFRERVVIDGRPVDPRRLESALRRLQPLADQVGATFFELTTALAFLCFAEEAVDLVVAEVGLGGRLDATNVLLPRVTAITHLGWDHADYLGHSLTSIAREKAGICKPGVPLILGRLEPEAARVVREMAGRAGAPIRQVGVDAAIRRIRVSRQGTDLEYVSGDGEPIELHCPLIGAHQAWNTGMAVLAAQSLPDEWRPTATQIERGVRSVRWPGRLQIEAIGDTTWILDVAHNQVAVEALTQTLVNLDLQEPTAVVLAILGDKPWPEMLPPLLALADTAVFTIAPCAPVDRLWDPSAVARTVPGYSVEVIEEFRAAMSFAQSTARTIVVTGSSYTVADAMRYLELPVSLLDASRHG